MADAPREITRFKDGSTLESGIPNGSRLEQFGHDRYVRADAISLSDALAIPEIAALVEAANAMGAGDMPCKPSCGIVGGYGYCTCGMEAKRNTLTAALRKIEEALG